MLSNLAMIHDCPARMPYFSDPQTARTVILQSSNTSCGFNLDLITSAPTGVLTLFNRYLFDKQSLTMTGAQTNSGE